MLAESVTRILELLGSEARVLDVGGWAKPFRRADAVVDCMPYGTRGLYGFDGDLAESFTASTWFQRDICARQRWPFADDEFDFVVCSHTLEDVRDPVWVCSEINRVGKAGYIEVPSRLEEQSYGFQGPWVGWGHHHWLVDIHGRELQFVFKHHVMHGRASDHFPAGFRDCLSEAERVQTLWWTNGFSFAERIFIGPDELDDYLRSFVAGELTARGLTPAEAGPSSFSHRAARKSKAVVRRFSRKG
jgi:hypothetical protein